MADIKLSAFPANTTIDDTVSVVSVVDNGDGTFTDKLTPVNLVSRPLSATYIGYGDISNLLTGSGDFIYADSASGRDAFNVGWSGVIVMQITPTACEINAPNGTVSIGSLNGGGTVIIVNDSMKTVQITNVPTYANDAAAILGGLSTGNLYKTTVGGITFQCIVP